MIPTGRFPGPIRSTRHVPLLLRRPMTRRPSVQSGERIILDRVLTSPPYSFRRRGHRWPFAKVGAWQFAVVPEKDSIINSRHLSISVSADTSKVRGSCASESGQKSIRVDCVMGGTIFDPGISMRGPRSREDPSMYGDLGT